MFPKVVFRLDAVKLLYTASSCTSRAQIQFSLASTPEDLKMSATASRPSSHPDETASTFSAFPTARHPDFQIWRLIPIFEKLSMDPDA